MGKRIASLILALIAVAHDVRATQKEKPATAPKAPELTAEEREIIKNRELLENLELLLNFEQIKFLDFFAEKKGKKSKEKPGAKAQVKENASKNPN